MKTLVGRMLVLAVGAVISAVGILAQDTSPDTTQAVTPAQIEGWKQELSNWGRGGSEDERGTLNLITKAKRRQAAALVREGFSVSLAREADYESNPDTELDIPGTGPYERHMARPTLDWFVLRYHGWAHTHIDSLAHGRNDGKSYNG